MSAHSGGTGRDYLLARIEAQDPALADRARRGMITVFRAAVSLGIVSDRFTVIVSSPEKIAAALRKNVDPATLHELVEILGREQ